MPKVVLSNLTNLQNEQSVVTSINNNNSLLELAVENTLSRDGASPNQMNTDLDMNSYRILNLPEPVSDTEPVRFVDVDISTISTIQALVDDAEDAQAAALVSASSASSSASSAASSASSASASASAAATSQSAAAASATAASGSATSASTSASNAASSASAASSSASSASTSATNAASSASSASTSASNASTSATSANNAKIAAEDARDAAIIAADNFDDVYLGSKATDPTLDNDGNPLVEGQLYWNSASNALRVYDGAAWQGYNPTAGVSGPVSSTNNRITLFDGTSGKLIKEATTTGIIKASSGVIAAAVAGTDYYNPGGTDVAIADGGTGASTASAAFTNLKQAASTTVTGVVELATDAETAAGTDTSRAVTPSNLTGSRIYGIIPQVSQSTNYTLVITDASKHIFHPASDNNPRTFTIPANSSVAYPVGTTITFVNRINTITIAITSDTMYLAGAGTTGSRTLAANGVATAIKISSTEWMISGTGLT